MSAIFRLRAPLAPDISLREADRSAKIVQNRFTHGYALFNSPYLAVVFAAWLGAGFFSAAPWVIAGWRRGDDIWSGAVTLFLLAAGVILFSWSAFQHFWRRFRGTPPGKAEKLAGPAGICWGDQAVRASQLGVAVRKAREWNAFRWRAFTGLEEKRGYIRLGITDDWAVIIPDAAFADMAERNAFIGFARKMMAAA